MDAALCARGYQRARGQHWVRTPTADCEEEVRLTVGGDLDDEPPRILLRAGRWDIYRARAALTGEEVRSSPYVSLLGDARVEGRRENVAPLDRHGSLAAITPAFLVEGTLAVEGRWFERLRDLRSWLEALEGLVEKGTCGSFTHSDLAIGWWLLGERKHMLRALRAGKRWIHANAVWWWLPGTGIRSLDELKAKIANHAPETLLNP